MQRQGHNLTCLMAQVTLDVAPFMKRLEDIAFMPYGPRTRWWQVACTQRNAKQRGQKKQSGIGFVRLIVYNAGCAMAFIWLLTPLPHYSLDCKPIYTMQTCTKQLIWKIVRGTTEHWHARFTKLGLQQLFVSSTSSNKATGLQCHKHQHAQGPEWVGMKSAVY